MRKAEQDLLESNAAGGLPGFWTSPSEASVDTWETSRRPELLEMFATYIYGRTPPGGRLDQLVTVGRAEDALEGAATRIELDLTVTGPVGARTLALLVYAPAHAADKPAPAFVGLNFKGNHTTTADAGVRQPTTLASIAGAHGGSVPERGSQARRWPLLKIINRGYAIATMCYEELEIDLPGFAQRGVRGIFHPDTRQQGDSWGAIGAWAWGLSRVLDALHELPEIDDQRAIAVGHSRLGKTALWAAAQDQRFAGVVSNDSGCGGASLFRHRGIEDVEVITSARPHWFAPRLAYYCGADEQLPIDQHQLLALQAPRLTHVGSASRDDGADPEGEFLSTLLGSSVFELYGHQGTRPTGADLAEFDLARQRGHEILPRPGTLVGGRLSYHLRDGDHDMLAEDWDHILEVADRHLVPASWRRRSHPGRATDT